MLNFYRTWVSLKLMEMEDVPEVYRKMLLEEEQKSD